MKDLLILSLLVFFIIPVKGQSNLLLDPSAESGNPAVNGWNDVLSGYDSANCMGYKGWSMFPANSGRPTVYPLPESGSYIFFPGCGGLGTGVVYELNQIVDVSLNANVIDAGWNSFTFSGWMAVYNQNPTDQAQMMVEYRNAANTVLSTYNTGVTYSGATSTPNIVGRWVNFVNTIVAPVGTRNIRVRLLGTSKDGASIDSYFDNLSLSTNIALPIVLIFFNATASTDAVKLNWATNSEINTSYFIVQKSKDEVSWNDVSKVNSSGNSNTQENYEATDNNPYTGTSFYRLMITGNDGKSIFSKVEPVYFAKGFGGIEVFPNPVHDFFTVKADGLEAMQINVYNSLGQLIKLSSIVNGTLMTFNTSGIAKGIYFVRLNNGNNVAVKKISIQ